MTPNVFISGASSGIGFATAKLLDSMGWRVYALALPQADFTPLKQVCSSRLVTLTIDLCQTSEVLALAELLDEEIGVLHALVNNAGINIPSPLESLSLAELKQQFEVNVFAHFQVTQAFLPLLQKAPDSRIVNVSSLMGKVAMPLLGAYSMSKHALEAMTDVLRLELESSQIQVASVLAGAIQTPMTDSMSQVLEERLAQSPESIRRRYASLYQGMIRALVKQSQTASPPEKVAEAIVHAITSPKAKTRYLIGADVKGLIAMRLLAPDTIGDTILKRALGLI